MREIKFRAWLPTIKKMTYSHTLQELLHFPHPDEFPDNTEWLQFTGLVDRNGKEIYEGDIVRIIERGYDNINDIDHFEQWLENENVISQAIDEDGYIEYQYSKKTDTVVMNRFPCYWLKNETFGYEGEDMVSPSDCEVIGNIYENPDLLEGSGSERPKASDPAE